MRFGALAVLALSASLLLLAPLTADEASGPESPISNDEQVILFPTCARTETGYWKFSIHGWIFELEEGSSWRAGLSGLLSGIAVDDELLEKNPAFEKNFRQRLRYFLADNERGKVIPIDIAGRTVIAEPSGANGHFIARVSLALDTMDAKACEFLEFTARTPPGDERGFEGVVQLVPEKGVSVISDIDDTVKVTCVLERREMIRNTFYRPFEAVAGMAEAYRKWQAKGAVFHYLSASPWQLYPALSAFLQREKFPRGSFSLRNFRLKDRSLFDFLGGSMEYKLGVIDELMKGFPARRFILVGDSGEKDPEIYGRVARRNPEQVLKVFIRRVAGSDLSEARLEKAFKGVPASRWVVFDDPSDLEKFKP